VGATVSIVDDDPWAREGIKDLVASLGYRAFSFASAEEFLESGSVDESECVILDVQMPGLTGLDLQQFLTEQGCGIAVIMITAHPDEGCRRRALEAGALAFLTKPLDDADLVRCLTTAVGPPLS
jgi:FixJ family two-component response regulator